MRPFQLFFNHSALTAALAFLLPGVAAAAAAVDFPEPKLLTASIYDKPEGRLLFTFRRTTTQTGDVVRVLREFRDTNGALAAVERVVYDRGRLVRFELDELQLGNHGYAAIKDGRIEFEYVTGSGANAKTKRNVETVTDSILIADRVGPFLAEHWDELNRGGVVKYRYIVVPRLQTIGFKLTREGAADFHGKKVVQIKKSPTSWLVSQALDPLIFTVETDPPHLVLQYWGRTTPKLRVGQSWRDLDALTVFDWPAK